MGSINSYGQAVQEILLNNYLKAILKTQKLEILSPLLEFHKVKIFLKKSPLFRTWNVNISRTAYDGKINEPILKSSH